MPKSESVIHSYTEVTINEDFCSIQLLDQGLPDSIIQDSLDMSVIYL